MTNYYSFVFHVFKWKYEQERLLSELIEKGNSSLGKINRLFVPQIYLVKNQINNLIKKCLYHYNHKTRLWSRSKSVAAKIYFIFLIGFLILMSI